MLARNLVILTALAGCGSNGVSHIIDGPPGGSDGSVGDDAPNTNTATITITSNGAGLLGVVVYFEDSASASTDAETTDASGDATGIVGSGTGFVTAINPYATASTTDRLITWSGVKAGDHVYFNANSGALDVTIKIPPATGAANYTISTTCGAGTFPAPVTTGPPVAFTEIVALTGCLGPQNVMVVALDGNNQAISSIYAAAQTLTAAVTLDLSASTYTAATARTYTWNNFNETATTLAMVDTQTSAIGDVFASASIDAAGTPPTIARTAPLNAALHDIVGATAKVGSTNHSMEEWGQTGATYTGDWNAQRLPDFSAAPAYDPVGKTITWTPTGGTVQPNVYETIAVAQRASDEHAWDWVVFSLASPVQLPTLPTTTYDWNIAATDKLVELVPAMIDVPVDPHTLLLTLGGGGALALENGAPGVVSIASYAPPLANPGIVRPLALH